MGVAFPEKPRIIEYGQLNECLQGGVEFPTGGTVRDRAFEKAPADSVQLRDQRLQSGWKKMCVKTIAHLLMLFWLLEDMCFQGYQKTKECFLCLQAPKN